MCGMTYVSVFTVPAAPERFPATTPAASTLHKIIVKKSTVHYAHQEHPVLNISKSKSPGPALLCALLAPGRLPSGATDPSWVSWKKLPEPNICDYLILDIEANPDGSYNAIPWTRWIRLFENFLLASGAADLPAPRRRALLLHCLGPEGQRIFDALPTTPTAPQLPTTEPLAAAATSTGEVKDRGVASKQEAAATSLSDVYDAAREILERHFAGARNIRLERHHFRERRQLHGESIPDFAFALRELAASCEFAEQAKDNMCDQFVTGVASPQLRSRLLLEGDTLTFDRAVEIALLSERAQLQSEASSNSVECITRQHPCQYDASERSTHDSRRYSNEARPLYQSRPSLPHARQTSSPSSVTDAADVQYSKNMQACNCGTRHCEPTACPARGRTCFACGRRGHFMRVCRSSRIARGQRPTHIQEVVPAQDASDVISLLTVHEDKRKGVYIDVVVTPVASSSEPRVAKFLVDTGSAVSIIREQEFRNMFEGVLLTSSALTLLDFQRRKIPVLGQL
ncbi:hypothetical protein MTO96_004579 [Rhipicephalus appendiculatus]